MGLSIQRGSTPAGLLWPAFVASIIGSACSSGSGGGSSATPAFIEDAGSEPVCLPITEVDGSACTPPALPVPDLHIAIDALHACAWRNTGPVKCWGRNAAGELGDPSLAPHATPTIVPGLSDVLQVTVGDSGVSGFSCALLKDGTVNCWGQNEEGQLGDGTFSPYRAEPAPVVGLTNVVEIATGTDHSCARLSTNEVRCWGMGRGCDLGDGACTDRATPVVASGLTDVSQLSLGMGFSCALKQDGTVWCWGSNSQGQAGVADQIAVLVPAPVEGLRDVVRLSGDHFNPCAQTRDGRVFCWGANGPGWLGMCAPRDAAILTPCPVHGLPCGGVLMPGGHCAVTSDGSAWCWGTRSGDGTSSIHTEGAVRVPLEGIVATAGFGSLFAIGRDGRLWSWGGGESGQLLTGDTTNRWTPVLVANPP